LDKGLFGLACEHGADELRQMGLRGQPGDIGMAS